MILATEKLAKALMEAAQEFRDETGVNVHDVVFVWSTDQQTTRLTAHQLPVKIGYYRS